MINNLLSKKVNDGARHFVDLPEVIFFDDFADHVEELEDAEIVEFITNGVIEMWLDFEFRGQRFSVINELGDYQFYVADPNCPEEILFEVIDHFRELLER